MLEGMNSYLQIELCDVDNNRKQTKTLLSVWSVLFFNSILN